MINQYVVAIDGIPALNAIENLDENIVTAARQAVNKTVDRARASARRAILAQVNFPASYLSDSGGRLSIVKRASDKDLTAIIQGRDRPTSLARFATGTVGSRGVQVRVDPGRSLRSKRMFLMRLRAGSASIDTKSNLGLAIRLRPGEQIEHKKRMIQLSKNLYLLYGPSVAQVFAGVADDLAPETTAFLETEFLRLMELN